MFPRHGWLVGSQVEEAAQAKLWRCKRALDGLVPHRGVETQFLVMGILRCRVRAQVLCLNPTSTCPTPPGMSF